MRIRNRRDCAKAWATQAKSQGRAASVFFEGATIYSYGYHFPIARLTTDAKGRTVALFTTRDYSVTTSGHKSLTRMALYRAEVRYFTVPNLEPRDKWEHEGNVVDLLARAAEAHMKAKRARTYREFHLERAAELEQEARDYAEAFGLNVNKERAA
jgi:hypothetical protein